MNDNLEFICHQIMIQKETNIALNVALVQSMARLLQILTIVTPIAHFISSTIGICAAIALSKALMRIISNEIVCII